MIATYTTGNGFKGAINYDVQEKKGAEVVVVNNLICDYDKNGRVITAGYWSKQMRENALNRPRVKSPVMHASISFSPTERLTPEKEKEAVLRSLNYVGINSNDYQYIITKHNDTAHSHYHVVVNRVDLSGDLHNDRRLMDRLQVSCDRVEKEMNLQPTPGRTVFYAPDTEKGYKYKSEITKERAAKKIKPTTYPKEFDIKTNIKDCYIEAKGRAKNADELKSILEKKNISVNIRTNKTGIYGMTFRSENIAVKASDLGIRAKELNDALEKNKKEFESKSIPDIQEQMNNGLKELNLTNKGYLTDRQNYRTMVKEYHPNGPSKNDTAEKYGLNKESFLSDLDRIDKAWSDSQQKAKELAKERLDKYQSLKNTPMKSPTFFTGKSSKLEIKTFNQNLKENTEYARLNLMNDNDISGVATKDFNQARMDIENNRLNEMKSQNNSNIEAIKSDYSMVYNIDLQKEIDKRLAEKSIKVKQEKEQEKEKKTSKNYERGR